MALNVEEIRGLWTSPADGDTAKGHLAVADNVAFYRPGLAEPRRGFEALSADLATTWNRSAVFEDTLIAHHGTSSISRWTGSAWSAYSGTFTPPTGVKVRFWESQGSLFVSTTEGVYELDDPAGTWRRTGSPAALQGSVALRRSTNETGFASAAGQWAYRLVWGYKNANDRLQLGAPSGRFLLTNPAAVTATNTNISKANGSTTVTVASTTHGFVTGEYVDVTLSGVETYFAAGRFQVTVVSATSFTYSDAVNNGSGATQTATNNIEYGFSSRNATITAAIPSGITAQHFLQVYRSVKSATANTEPNDALALVYERSPTNLEITAGSMTVTDISPDELRGAELYTSLGTILDAKHQPPSCVDAAEYGGSVFCGATASLHSMDLQLIAVGSPHGMVAGDVVRFVSDPNNISSATWSVFVTGQATENLSLGIFRLYTSGTAAQNIAETAKSIVRAINSKTTNTRVYAEYLSSDIEAPGRFRVYARSLAEEKFACIGVAAGAGVMFGDTFAPALPTAAEINTLERAWSTVTATVHVPHEFAVGQTIELVESSDTGTFPNGIKTVATVPTSMSFTYTETGPAAGAVGNSGRYLDAPASDLTSLNTSRPNGLMWSQPGEPWAFRLIDLQTVGTGTLLRLIPSRDRLFVLTTKGAYQVTGTYPNWSITEYDRTLNLVAYDMAVAQGDRVYGLFEAGFMELLESARVADFAINKDIRDLMASSISAINTYGFAVPYESENMVLFFMPDSSDDTASQQVYVLRTDTGDWTRWPIADTKTAIVSPDDDKLYIGKSSGATWKERKARTTADQADPGNTAISVTMECIAQDAGNPGAQKVWGTPGVFTFRDAQFANMGLAFRTDLSPTLSVAYNVGPAGGATSSSKPVDFWVAKTHMRGARWAWRLTHATLSERFALQGLRMEYYVCSPLSSR